MAFWKKKKKGHNFLPFEIFSKFFFCGGVCIVERSFGMPKAILAFSQMDKTKKNMAALDPLKWAFKNCAFLMMSPGWFA